jgi:hypothetical protein
MHRKLGRVVAFKSELDRWMDERCSLQSKKTATSLHAYELYLKGRQLVHQFRRKNFERAREMFARAIEVDLSSPLPTLDSPTAVLICISTGRRHARTWKLPIRPAARL